MNNFSYQRKTNIIFGNDQLDQLPNEISLYGKRVLLTYGLSSIKNNGLYDKVVNLLNENEIFFVELSGIKPNPEVDTVLKGVSLIEEHNLDFVLAVGGGSVIDNSKHMIMALASDNDIWDIINNPKLLSNDSNKYIPLGTILTISATGSEMNGGGVITNPLTKEKLAIASKYTIPVFSFLDPSLLSTLPIKQKIAGVCDTLSHLLEVYFNSHEDCGFSDRIIEAIFINTLDYSESYLAQHCDYEANAQIMLSATYALNGITGIGTSGGCWQTHSLEHELSALNDFIHGIGLALIQPYVLKTHFENDIKNSESIVKFVNIGRNIYKLDGDDLDVATKSVQCIKDTFFNLIIKTTLREYNIEDFDYQRAAKMLVDHNRLNDAYRSLTYEEIINIYKQIL